MFEKKKVYYHWRVHWDLHKVMSAFAARYKLEYKIGDHASTEAIVIRAYKEYHGINELNNDTHMRRIKDQVREMLKDTDAIAPDCVRFLALHHAKQKLDGFDLIDLVGPSPYPDHWEMPRPQNGGEIALSHHAV